MHPGEGRCRPYAHPLHQERDYLNRVAKINGPLPRGFSQASANIALRSCGLAAYTGGSKDCASYASGSIVSELPASI